MELDYRIIIQIMFSIFYLIYISLIVILMSINLNKVNRDEVKTAKYIRLAFFSLLIGDLGHVGARLITFFWEDNA